MYHSGVGQIVKEEPNRPKEESNTAQIPSLGETTDMSDFYIRLLYDHRKKIRRTTFEPLMEFKDLVNMIVSAFPTLKKKKYHLEWEKTWVEDVDDWEVVFSDWRDRACGDTIAGKNYMDIEIISDDAHVSSQQVAMCNQMQKAHPSKVSASNNNSSRFHPYQQQNQPPPQSSGGNIPRNHDENWNTSNNYSHQQNTGWNRGAVANKRGPAGFKNHDQKMDALWQLCTQIMRQNPRGMNVLHLRVECMRRGWSEGKPRVKDVNYLLYKHEELGAIYKEQLDPTSKPKWRLCS